MSWDDNKRPQRKEFGRISSMSVLRESIGVNRAVILIGTVAFLAVIAAVLLFSSIKLSDPDSYDPTAKVFSVTDKGLWHSIYQEILVGTDDQIYVKEVARKELPSGMEVPPFITRYIGPRVVGPTAPQGRPIEIHSLKSYPKSNSAPDGAPARAPVVEPSAAFWSFPGKVAMLQLPVFQQPGAESLSATGGAMLLIEAEYYVKGVVWRDESLNLKQMLWEPARALQERAQSVTASVKLSPEVTAFVAGVAIIREGQTIAKLTVDRAAPTLQAQDNRLELQVFDSGVPEFRAATTAPLGEDDTMVVWATYVGDTIPG